MGTEVLLAVLCCLAAAEASANVFSIATPVRVIDGLKAGSVSRLYRNVPLGVYASASPYAAYSFNVPTFVAPTNSNQNIIPVKENSVTQSSQGFLRDSYGQKYQEKTPQSIAYKTTFPQQYVQLQNLPAHLSQPLVSATPNFQFRQVTPHFFGSNQFTVPSVQSFPPTIINRYVQSPQPAANQPFTQSAYTQNNINNAFSHQLPPVTHSQIIFKPITQTQLPSNNDVHVDTHTKEKYSPLKSEPKTQYLSPQPAHTTPEIIEQNAKQSQQSIKKQILNRPKDPVVTTHVNGETIVTIPTKPNLPLLDLSLLEPLTFDNPLVPQVQHFLPRINQATYHKLPNNNERNKNKKEFTVQNTKSYDSTQGKSKPKKESPKKKQKKQRPQNEYKDEDDNPIKSITVIGTPNESPEFSYEIDSPNYKETYSEKKVQYNKETQSEPIHYNYEKQTQKEPVHYSYEKHTQNEPVHYSYTTSSKEPGKIQQIIYSNKDEPKQLIFHFKPEIKDSKNYEERVLSSPQTGSEEQINEHPSDPEKRQENVRSHNKNQETDNGEPKQKHHYQPEHRENDSQEHNNNSGLRNHNNNAPIEHHEHKQIEQHYLKPTTAEYEEDITILPTYPPQAQPSFNENLEEQDRPHDNHHSPTPTKYFTSYNSKNTAYSQQPLVHENSKRIIIKEESPEESQPDSGQLMAEMIKQQQESEHDFEQAYKNAAYGFPAFDTPSVDVEKEIYNPESYGAPKYHKDYDIQNTPLQQYQLEGDDYPAHTRSNYKDERDKMQEEYYLDYAISRPESILERYKNKEDYYKMFAKHKPEKYFGGNEENKKSAKYTFSFQPLEKIENGVKQKSAPYVYGYPSNIVKESPRDNSAFATRPTNHRYKSKTQFVEPQYQYGFEPLSIPQLLDSELAAMASNDNVENENPGTRKKVYKENWYIKKTTTGKAR